MSEFLNYIAGFNANGITFDLRQTQLGWEVTARRVIGSQLITGTATNSNPFIAVSEAQLRCLHSGEVPPRPVAVPRRT